MPIYTMHCQHCGHEEDIYRSIAKMDEDLPTCCEAKMQRKVVAPMVAADIAPYKSMVTGEMIESRSKHRAHLKQHGLIEVGNEKIKPRGPLKPPPGRKEKLIEIANKVLK